MKYGLTKEEIVATRAANEIFLHSIKLIIYISLGLYSQAAIWLGLTIAIASIISSYTVKYILPYLSEFLFRKIGYSAMVLSGIVLFINTSQAIIKQDNISFSSDEKNKKSETTIKWRESDFILEYALDDGLEIERPIKPKELPDHLLTKHNKLLLEFDKITIEKVFKFGKEKSYEFYCFKNNVLTKFEFEESD